MNGAGRTVLKACPGLTFSDTDWTVEDGEKVYQLLRKSEDDQANWLFIRGLKGFGWLQEQPKTAAKLKAPADPASN